MGDKPCTLVFSYNPSKIIGDEDDKETIQEHFYLKITCSGTKILYGKHFDTKDKENIDSIKIDLKKLKNFIVHPTEDRPIETKITIDECNDLIKKYQLKSFVLGGSRRRRRPSRKYKKSAKRVFRKKSRSTRRR